MRVIARGELYGPQVNWLVNPGSEKMRSCTLSTGTISLEAMVMVVVTITSPPGAVELGDGVGAAT